MSKAPAYQHYPKDHAAKETVKLMDLREEGAYLRLRDHQWLTGSIPASVADLALICRVPRALMARVWPGISGCFVEVTPGRLVDPDLEAQRERQERYRHERAESGRRGALSRHGSAMAQPHKEDGSAMAQLKPPYSVLRSPVSDRQTATPAGEEPPPTTATPEEARRKAVEHLGPVECRHPSLAGKITRPGHSLVCPDCGEDVKAAPKGNPFIQRDGRDKWEREALTLTESIAALTGEDGPEIIARAAHYAGAPPGRTKCNPANMGDDRLVNTVLDLRATLKAEQEKRGKGAA